MVKDTYWFQHDYNARNDVKIQALMTDHGAAGYGVFFILLEVLREQSDYRLKLDRYTYDTLAAQSRSDKKTVKKILKDCMEKYIDADCSLICTDGEYIWSDGLIKRLEGLKENRERRSEAARKAVNSRWNKERGDTNVLQNDTNVLRNDTITEQYSTEEYSTEQNITEEYSTEEYTTKQDTKKENEEEGGGSIGEAIVSDFFAEEALEPDNYFGANEETKSEADKLTNEIWKRFVPEGAPSDFDKRMVFCKVIGADKDENGEWRGYISREKTDVLLYAFKAAAMANKTGNWNYIESVLRRAEDEGLKTLKEIEDRDFEKGKM